MPFFSCSHISDNKLRKELGDQSVSVSVTDVGYTTISTTNTTEKTSEKKKPHNFFLLVGKDNSFRNVKATIRRDLKLCKMNFPTKEHENGFIEAVMILAMAYQGREDVTKWDDDFCNRITAFVFNALMACFNNQDFFYQRQNELLQLQPKFPNGIAFLSELEGYSDKTSNLATFCTRQLDVLEMTSKESILETIGENKIIEAMSVKQTAKLALNTWNNFITSYKESVQEDETVQTEEYKKVKQTISLRSFLKKWTPFSLAEYIKKFIAGQDKAVDIFAQMCFEHVARVANPTANIRKSNYVMFGPTGCGKTEMAKVVRQVLPVPIEVVDASAITSQGFKGMDKEELLSNLLQKHGENLLNAIIILDEFDKLCYKRTASGGDDVNRSIQFDLLKMIEGTTLYVKYSAFEGTVPLDTTNMTFVCAGAFDGAFTPNIKKAFGFGSMDVDTKEEKTILNCLLDFGMVPEIAGRISTLIPLKQLDVHDLYDILVKTENNCISSIKNLYQCAYHIKLSFTEEALMEICHSAYQTQLGARSLQSIVETVCHSVLDKQIYTAMSRMGNPTIEITSDIVQNGYVGLNKNKGNYARLAEAR